MASKKAKKDRKDESKDKSQENKIEKVVAPDFVLDDYISNYAGSTKIARLLFIAQRVEVLEEQALRRAIDLLKGADEPQNTTKYLAVCETLKTRCGTDLADTAWADNVDKKATARLENLEMQLNGYRTNLIKESIRRGYNDLGDFHCNKGDLSAAFKCYLRTRDYCTTSDHILTMCMNVIKVSIELENYPTVTNYVNKALNTPDWHDPTKATHLRCCAGLAALHAMNYKIAARFFLDSEFSLGGDFSKLMSPQDVAIYGGLCALASFDRNELRKKVIDNQQFKQFLELTPDLRELINDFYNSRYGSCLSYLETMRVNLLLDVHVGKHVNNLYKDVRKKALIQYFSPFMSVDLKRMATAFNTDVPGIEKELTGLIIEGQIQARIDSHNKVLHARSADQRVATYQSALRVGKDYQRTTKAMILRCNLVASEFYVKGQRRDREGGDAPDSSARS